ncbi:MAG: bifunctional DNA primase/polymerase [Planctomycetota bacterium]
MKVLEAALEYHRLGWSLIPIRAGTKEPCVKWARYQITRADEEAVREWFGDDAPRSLAVILGEVSGSLICRDFDKIESYELWATERGELARTLPTVETKRGKHVYCRGNVEQVRANSKSDGTIISFDDGEVRAGGYCLLPPSVHPSGHVYHWIGAVPEDVPFIDLDSAGFLCNREDGENRGGQKTLGCCSLPSLTSPTSPSTLSSLLHEALDKAVRRTIPEGHGHRHHKLFHLARAIKALPGLADAPVNELKPYVRKWHEQALPHIRTKAFEESWFDFAEAWDKVRFPEGAGPMDEIYQRAVRTDPPEVASQYESPKLRLLVALCRELQRVWGDAPFYLSVRTAAHYVEVDVSTACRWLRGLRLDGILKLTTRGDQKKRRASRYVYLAD